MRFYRTDRNVWLPSVTTILGKTATESSKATLRNWELNNPGGKEAAAERGSDVHKACEDYVRGKTVSVLPAHQCYWDGLAPYLDQYDGFIWSERPLLPEHQFCLGEDDIARVWSHEYGYCGCPDLIGFRNGVYILSDFKSSNGPYCRRFPKDPENRKYFGGHMKYAKCAMQLAAYRIAIRETLGIHVDVLQILVTTPEITQCFYIHGPELRRYEYKWLQRVRKYQDMQLDQQKAALEAQLALV